MHVGVVGLGYWGSKHARVLSSLQPVDAVSGFDLDPTRCSDVATSVPAMRIASDVPTLLKAVDAVVIATHPSTHADLAMQALSQGVHVLVEKPLALNSADALALSAFARSLGLTLMVGHTFAYNPAVTALREVIAAGELGRVLQINSQRLNLGLFQPDCDVMWDLAPHDISIINLLTGETPTAVWAKGRGHIHPEITDHAHIGLDYGESGVQATIHVSWLDPHKVRRITVVGSRRMAVYDDLAEERLKIYDKGVHRTTQLASHQQPLSYRYGAISSPYIPFQEPLLLEDRHFVDCVSTGARPRSDDEAGLAVVRTLEAATTSLREGREVSLKGIGRRAPLAPATAPSLSMSS